MNRFQYFSRSRKLKRIFTIFYAGVMVLLLLSSLFQSASYQRHLEHDKKTYGNWNVMFLHADTDLLEKIEKNQMVEEAGIIQINDKTQMNDRSIISGYFDKKALAMSDFTLKAGRYPEKEDEILVDIALLDELSLPYETGQTLEVEMNGKKQSLSVGGIIQNYRRSWIYGANLPQIITGQTLISTDEVLLVQMKPGFTDAAQDLKSLSNNPVLINTNAELSFDLFSQDNTVFTLLNGCIVIASLLMLLFFSSNWISSHLQEIMTLKLLGASSGNMNKDLNRIVIKTAACSVLLFILLAWILKVEKILIVFDLVLYFIMVLLSVWIFKYMIKRIPSVFTEYTQTSALGRSFKTGRKPITIFKITVRYIQANLKSFTFQTVTLAILLLALSGALILFHQNQLYKEQALYSSDFYLQKEPFNENAYTTLDEESIEKLESLPNVKDIEMYWFEFGTTLCWNDEGQSMLRDIDSEELMSSVGLMQNASENGLEVSGITGYGIDHLHSKSEVFESIDSPVFNQDQFNAGNQIILFLPELADQKTSSSGKEITGSLTARYGIKDYLADPNQYKSLEESSIQEGDRVTIEIEGQSKEVEVGAVLRTAFPFLSNQGLGFIAGYPYSYIASDAFFNQQPAVNAVEISLDSYQNLDAIEEQVKMIALANKMNLVNNSTDNVKLSSFFAHEIQIYGIGSIFLALLFIGTLIFFALKNQKQIFAFESELESACVSKAKVQRFQTLYILMLMASILLLYIILSRLFIGILSQIIPNLSELRSLSQLFDPSTGEPALIRNWMKIDLFRCWAVLIPLSILIIAGTYRIVLTKRR